MTVSMVKPPAGTLHSKPRSHVMSHISRNDQAARDAKLAAGIAKYVDQGQSFVSAGNTYPPADIPAIVQGRIDKAKSVNVAKATWLALLKALEGEYDQTKAFVEAVRQAMLIMFAASPDALIEMGLAPRKPR